MSIKHVQWLLLLLFLTAVFSLTIRTVGETFGDVGYEMKTGEYVLQHFSVPHEDIFSFAYPKNEWIAHYWLSGIILFFEYKWLGFLGLTLGTSLIAALTYFFVYKTALLKSGRNLLSLILIIPLSFITYDAWFTRPQIFSYLCTAILIFLLEKWKSAPSSKLLYLMPPLMLVWANLHGGVILGIAILGAYMLENIIKKYDVRFLITALTSIAATLINPNGYKLIIFSWTISPAVKAMNVLEFRSLLDFLQTGEAKFFLCLSIALTAFISYKIFGKKRAFRNWPIADTLLTLAAFAMPLISIRYVGFFPILILPIFISYLKRKTKLSSKNWVLLSLTTLTAFLLLNALSIFQAFRTPVTSSFFLPAEAVGFVEYNNLADNMFNDPIFGGYLIHRLYPNHKIFIDGRSDVYSGAVDQEYLSIVRQSPDWEKIVDDKYKFNSFFLSYRDANANYVADLFNALTKNNEFKLVYWGESVIVLVRNTPENKTVIDKYGYNVVSPYVSPQNVPKEKNQEYQAELKRVRTQSPDALFFYNQ